MKAPEGPTDDGRARRRERNREAIVRALYDLVRETHQPASVEEIAQRAGVGTRTVFRLFEDLDTLYRSVNERVLAEVMARFQVPELTGVLEHDLAAVVAARARVYEHVTPFRRAQRLARHQSAYLRERDAMAAQILRARLEVVVAPHLGEGAEDALEALDALLSFDVWDRLRDAQQLGVRAAERVVLRAALAVATASTKPHAEHPKG